MAEFVPVEAVVRFYVSPLSQLPLWLLGRLRKEKDNISFKVSTGFYRVS